MKVSDMFPSRYLTGADLKGKSYPMIMREVVKETVQTAQGRKDFFVLYFDGAEKGLILNRTNAEAIARLYGDETASWPGKKITIYPAQIKVAGEDRDAIRVKPTGGTQ